MAIPRTIVTVWVGGPMPELVKKCIESQKKCAKKFDYSHIIIDNEYAERHGDRYVDDCMDRSDSIGYVKAADWLRVHFIHKFGGIHLDSDMEVLPGKNFDHLLENKMFVPKDPQGHFGNAGFGAEPGDPLLKLYMERVSQNFKGHGGLAYEPGVRAFSDMFYVMDTSYVKILTPDYFFPYNHLLNTENITDNTLVKHWYMDSWINKDKV